jgi:hypothetical protein
MRSMLGSPTKEKINRSINSKNNIFIFSSSYFIFYCFLFYWVPVL